ncbi:hypothetical protein CFK40_04720 [Virgibacillus necropolis]|uniref:Uncharacterized protein n=1 Tax=Virgibacillus necropolis TaxID=163877 RepID=A0A221M9Q9_9BACI|nr:hypothetical protein CFK40_04720 [Virgibacillus necropolis]
MCNNKTCEVFQQEQQRIIKRLEKVGIKASIGKRVPRGGFYSGIVGKQRKVLNVNIPCCYGNYKTND